MKERLQGAESKDKLTKPVYMEDSSIMKIWCTFFSTMASSTKRARSFPSAFFYIRYIWCFIIMITFWVALRVPNFCQTQLPTDTWMQLLYNDSNSSLQCNLLNIFISWNKNFKWENQAGNYLPKGIAAINQFICSPLKSTFNTLSEDNPVLAQL